MTLDSYTTLIKYLPYLDQAFETKRENWIQHPKSNTIFADFYQRTFLNESLKLSRADLFGACKHNFHDAIFSIIFWGYPRNMRGKNFESILNSLNGIESALGTQRNLSADDFIMMCDNLKSTGVGLSTLSKFLYFFEYKLENHQCLILDRRIMDVINDENGFIEMKNFSLKERITEFNKRKKYVAYLHLMEDLSSKNRYKADQLEFFLFSMGKNLKPTKKK